MSNEILWQPLGDYDQAHPLLLLELSWPEPFMHRA